MGVIERYRTAAAKVREMEKAATPGPWYPSLAEEVEGWAIFFDDDKNGGVGSVGDVTPKENARLICASRNLLPALLDAGDALCGSVIARMILDNNYDGVEIKALATLTDALEKELGENNGS